MPKAEKTDADKLHDQIVKYSTSIWKPINIENEQLDTNSWYKMFIGMNNDSIEETQHNFKIDELEKVKYKCRKKIIIPNEQQKEILLDWFDGYIRMYNETNKFIKRELYKKHKVSFNWKIVRTCYMKKVKEEICKSTQLETTTKNTKINQHILDGAIKDVCTSYKSAFTNLRNGNIKHFTIRYIKTSKKQKIIKIEKELFKKKSFCTSILGKVMETNDNSDFTDITSESTLLYNSLNNRFTLLIPEEIEYEHLNKEKTNSSIALDMGITTFATGYTQGHILEIGTGLRATISKYLKEIDSINKRTDLDTQKKRKAENKRYQQISNLIDDLHWKSIKYLVENYKTILIGNLSTKGIARNPHLDDMTKRVGLLMKLYVFRERLKYKCYLNDCNYRLVNEKHTTQMCTFCGNIRRDVGRAKVYYCEKCNSTIGRDVNGSRNIYMVDIQQ